VLNLSLTKDLSPGTKRWKIRVVFAVLGWHIRQKQERVGSAAGKATREMSATLYVMDNEAFLHCFMPI